ATLSTSARARQLPAMTESRLHLRDLLQVLIAHWKVVVGITLAVVLGVYFTGRTAIPRYQARATVQVNSKKQVFSRLDETGVEEDSLAQPDSFALRVNGARGWELHDRRGRALSSGSYETPVAGPGFTFMVHADEGTPFTTRFAVLPRVTAADIVRGGINYS